MPADARVFPVPGLSALGYLAGGCFPPTWHKLLQSCQTYFFILTRAILSAEGRFASETRKACATMGSIAGALHDNGAAADDAGSIAGALHDNGAAADDALSTMQKE